MTNDGDMVNRVGLSRKHIFDAVEASVKRLGTYIDVLQIHRLDRETPREEIMKALNDVVEKGWVRYIGASSVSTLSAIIGTCIVMLNNGADGLLGVRFAPERRQRKRMASIHQHAKLLQSHLPRRRARDAPILPRHRRRHHPSESSSNHHPQVHAGKR